MKLCEYCGQENSDEAVACCGCGTREFVTAIPPTQTTIPSTTKDVEREPVETFADAAVELQRCPDPESLAQVTQILDAAGILYQRSSLPAMFDLGKIDAGDDAEVIVRVPRNRYAEGSNDGDCSRIIFAAVVVGLQLTVD